MANDVTQAEEEFMRHGPRHDGEDFRDRIRRERGVVSTQTRDGRPGPEIVIPEYAMDAVVPSRGTEAAQREGDKLSHADRERELRNAHAQANIMNDNPTMRR